MDRFHFVLIIGKQSLNSYILSLAYLSYMLQEPTQRDKYIEHRGLIKKRHRTSGSSLAYCNHQHTHRVGIGNGCSKYNEDIHVGSPVFHGFVGLDVEVTAT